MILHVVPYLEVHLPSLLPSTAAMNDRQREGYCRRAWSDGGPYNHQEVIEPQASCYVERAYNIYRKASRVIEYNRNDIHEKSCYYSNI